MIISIIQFGKSVENSIFEAKKQVALDLTSELPLQVAQFSRHASEVAVWVFLGEENLNENQRAQFIEVKKRQDELLPEIKDKIFAYGSKEAIEIFREFEYIISNPNNNGISITAYYLLPLLITQVKVDVTGEYINPLIFFDSLMPQFKEHRSKATDYIKVVIDDLNLDMKIKDTTY